MNVYSKFFAGQLGFNDEAAARESVGLIDRCTANSRWPTTGPASTMRC